MADAEIDSRIEIIRAAKHRLQRDLTDDELDGLLEPVQCLRTRTRLAKKITVEGSIPCPRRRPDHYRAKKIERLGTI